MLPQNCVVLCRWKRPLCQSVLLKPFRPIRSSDARLVEIGLRAEAKVKGNWTSNTRLLVCIIGALLFTLWVALWLHYY